MNDNSLPLRTGVGIVVLNSKKQVFVGKRKDNPTDKWQMPQGGVDQNEDLLSAMKRELAEETSIVSIKIIKELKEWLQYDLPKELLGKIWGGKYRSQKQKWFFVKFLGSDDEININTKNAEFIEWKWIDAEMLPKIIVEFKKDLYLNLLKEIKLVIG